MTKVAKKAAPEAPAEPPIDPDVAVQSIPDQDGPVWVTPAIAKMWLALNENNRSLRSHRINAMARDMKAEEWHYTGEPIKFSRTGRLIDGQHRLYAILESGATVKLLVVVNIDDEAQMYMDTGAKRSASDALTFRGEVHSANLGSAVRFAILFEEKRSRGRESITHAEIVNWLRRNPDIRQHVAVAARYASRIDIKPSVLAYAMWRLSKVDEQMSELFFSDLIEMRTTGAGDPTYTLLQRMRTARRHRERLSAHTELSFIFRTWNAVRGGHQLRVLKVLANDRDVVEPK